MMRSLGLRGRRLRGANLFFVVIGLLVLAYFVLDHQQQNDSSNERSHVVRGREIQPDNDKGQAIHDLQQQPVIPGHPDELAERKQAELEKRLREAKEKEERAAAAAAAKEKEERERSNKLQDEKDRMEAVKAAERAKAWMSAEPHPQLKMLANLHAFQGVVNQHGRPLNIILIRHDPSPSQIKLYEQYKDEILFVGISSFEDWPLPSVNPFSPRYPADKFTGMFPAFLHMLRDPQNYFPKHVKTILMSQSDFSLPPGMVRDYSVPKKYDFTYSGSDQDVRDDCVGWSSFAKNWSFVKQALEVMCGELDMTGVLVATKDKKGIKACTIPKSCEGKIVQTTFLNQDQFFSYVRQSRFQFLPQVHDASPRVAAQALAHDVPLLMNAHISGGWKYLDEECLTIPCPKNNVRKQKTGEFFNDITDFKEMVQKIVKNADIPGYYEPRKYLLDNYGDARSGKILYDFIMSNFGHRLVLPEGTTLILPGSFH
eukprot:m.2667 g.2667  ORF g.2667 m.2667 type:complete len:484 (-) comp2566_c0_seq1:34-1485(-)